MISISSFKPGSPPPFPPLLDPKNFRRFAAIFELFGAFYFFLIFQSFLFIFFLQKYFSCTKYNLRNCPSTIFCRWKGRRRRRENFWVYAIRVQLVRGGSSLQARELRLYAARIPFARAKSRRRRDFFKHTEVTIASGEGGSAAGAIFFEIVCCKLRSPIVK